MILRRKNRDTEKVFVAPEPASVAQPSIAVPNPPVPNPLVAIRGRLSTRLQYLDDSIRRQDQDKLTMQQEMESLKKQIFEIDRATLAQPILEKLGELYR